MKTELIVIENDADLAEATALVAALMKKPGTEARLRAQAKLVEDYESRKWPRRPIGLPALLTYVMDQHGLKRADLIPLFGTASRVSEVLNGKSSLSMTMVRRLHSRFGISAGLLIQPA
ncbi:MAG TPA: transcriptional regulator [Magnetospirillaceae bacterium]|jgi:HTH-type transcriptional regulator/antitoxin HigA